RHTRFDCDWSSDVCSSDLPLAKVGVIGDAPLGVALPATRAGIMVGEASPLRLHQRRLLDEDALALITLARAAEANDDGAQAASRSEERRVGKECRALW